MGLDSTVDVGRSRVILLDLVSLLDSISCALLFSLFLFSHLLLLLLLFFCVII